MKMESAESSITTATSYDFREPSRKLRPFPEIPGTQVVRAPRNDTTLMFQESKCKSGEHSQYSQLQSAMMGTDLPATHQ